MNSFWSGFEKRGHVYGHFIHTEGLTDDEHKDLLEHARAVRSTHIGATDAVMKHMSDRTPLAVSAKPYWRDSVVRAFLEKHPKLQGKVWSGTTIAYGPKEHKTGKDAHDYTGYNGHALHILRLDKTKDNKQSIHTLAHTIRDPDGELHSNVLPAWKSMGAVDHTHTGAKR